MDRELLPGLGHVKLSKLRAEDIDAFYARMRATGGGRRGNGLSPGTIKRAHGILRRALQQGVRWGWLGVNPAVGATPPRVLPSELRPPTPAELNRLLDTAERKNPEFATFVTLSATSGALRSELLALRWPDVDLDHATLTIARGIVLGDAGPRCVTGRATSASCRGHRHSCADDQVRPPVRDGYRPLHVARGVALPGASRDGVLAQPVPSRRWTTTRTNRAGLVDLPGRRTSSRTSGVFPIAACRPTCPHGHRARPDHRRRQPRHQPQGSPVLLDRRTHRTSTWCLIQTHHTRQPRADRLGTTR